MAMITEIMEQDHKECDTLFAQAEEAIQEKDFDKGEEYWNLFEGRTRAHFSLEEEELFPLFEEVTGMTQGPTQVMRMEHMQMKQILLKMGEGVRHHDDEAFFSMAETLMILMQQHNAKEEQMLYRMMDQALGDHKDRLTGILHKIKKDV